MRLLCWVVFVVVDGGVVGLCLCCICGGWLMLSIDD